MKVIGRTTGGFLVEASEIELAKASGFDRVYDAPWRKADPHALEAKILTGTEIAVSARFDRLSAIERAEAEVRKAATALRALADLAEKSIPSGVALPKPEFAEVEEEKS